MAVAVVKQVMELVDERKRPNKEILVEAAVLMNRRGRRQRGKAPIWGDLIETVKESSKEPVPSPRDFRVVKSSRSKRRAIVRSGERIIAFFHQLNVAAISRSM
jgi:hypothetical protein